MSLCWRAFLFLASQFSASSTAASVCLKGCAMWGSVKKSMSIEKSKEYQHYLLIFSTLKIEKHRNCHIKPWTYHLLWVFQLLLPACHIWQSSLEKHRNCHIKPWTYHLLWVFQLLLPACHIWQSSLKRRFFFLCWKTEKLRNGTLPIAPLVSIVPVPWVFWEYLW